MNSRRIRPLPFAAALVALPALAHATVFTYDFSALTPTPTADIPAYNAAPDANVSYQGTTTIGQTGPDNWIWNSSTANTYSAIARADTLPGMSGTYISSYPTNPNTATGAAPANYDTINSRKNTSSGFTYAIPEATTFAVSFIANISGITYTNASSVTTTSTSRAEIALGYDQNNDGDIRGDSASTENAEWGPFFGFEPSAAAGTAGLTGKWYVRPADLGTAVTVNASGPGVYKILLVVDPTANHVAAGNDGAGTLYVQELYDANGNPVTDTLHTVGATLTNVNLGLTRMTTTSAGGTTTGYDPALWNGLITREEYNGAIDNIQVLTGADAVVPEPASAAFALPALALLARRRR